MQVVQSMGGSITVSPEHFILLLPTPRTPDPGLVDVEAAKQRVSEKELLDQIEAFQASNGDPLDLFERITSVGVPFPGHAFALC